MRAVHESLGVIDVSTLGKLFVEGPEAVALLERLYPNRFGDMKPGRIRYGVLTSDGGRIMDDGTIARLADDLFYVTTTSTGADAVTAWFEWWNAVWGYDAEIVNVTGALAAVNLAGPRSRDALGASSRTGRRRRRGRSSTSTRRSSRSPASRRSRCGSASSASSATSSTSRARPASTSGTRSSPRARGRSASSRSACSGSRRATSSSARTRTRSRTSTPSGMSWLPKLDKDDFVGKFALEHFAQREEKERLVGFTMEEDVLPAEGAQIVIEGLPGGPRDERAAQRGGRRGHRARVGADRSLASPGRASRSRSTGCGAARASRTARSSIPSGERMRS